MIPRRSWMVPMPVPQVVLLSVVVFLGHQGTCLAQEASGIVLPPFPEIKVEKDKVERALEDRKLFVDHYRLTLILSNSIRRNPQSVIPPIGIAAETLLKRSLEYKYAFLTPEEASAC